MNSMISWREKEFRNHPYIFGRKIFLSDQLVVRKQECQKVSEGMLKPISVSGCCCEICLIVKPMLGF